MLRDQKAPAPRPAAGVARVVMVATLVTAMVGLPSGPFGPGPAAAYPAPTVDLTGHGFGHGRGMGQYGALGYALQGWTYQQILDHYYGGTTAGSVAAATLMTVDMTSRDGQDTIVAQERGELTTSPALPIGCTTGTPCAVRISRTGPGQFTVYSGGGCDGGTGGWKVVSSSVSATAVTVVASAGSTGVRQDMLQLCEANDTRWLRGNLVAQDTGTSQATVNVVPIDDYVRGVVPRESPASWGTLGGGAGEQALDAQAVAARSYAQSENRWPWAKTCDTTSCQVYGGRAVQDASGFTDLEGTPTYATSDSAVSGTAGQIRVFSSGGGGPAGTVVRTEYSSSTGGYTAGGVFPAVVDDGDATSTNPYHTWTASLSVASVSSAYGAGLGTLVSVAVSARNGLGDLGGRALSVVVTFSGGSVTVTGDAFAATFGLRSNWFTITNNAAAPYAALTADGNVYGFAGASVAGSPATQGVGVPSIGLAESPGGYWVLTADGAVHPFGGATSYGSVAGMHLNQPPRQIVATPSGHGYWIMASDGGVFSFGDARFHGSTGAMRLNAPIVGMAATRDGGGYWLLGADGGVFTFGDARFFGSTGAMRLNAPVNAMSPTPDGLGYWLAARDGGIFSFGSAVFEGSLPGRAISAVAVGMQTSPGGHGYLIATSDGSIYGFDDAVPAGGPAQAGAHAPTVGVAYTR